MDTVRAILAALARRYGFRELSYLVGEAADFDALPGRPAAKIQQLCAYGQRLLDLDAEDFAEADAATGSSTEGGQAQRYDERVPDHLVRRGRLARMRQSPGEQPRAALRTMRPAYRLLLEVIAARWTRREMAALVATLHLAGEYAPTLAWESILGHAADPAQLRDDPAFAGPQSRWGRFDEPGCPHTRPQKSAASRALKVMDEPAEGWRAYLNRQHSTVSQALGICAAECRTACTVMTAREEDERARIKEACRIARLYSTCAVVGLRHSSPAGHGFGVPSLDEVGDAWDRSRKAIARRGGPALAVMDDDGFPLPGLPSLFSAIGAVELTPDTLLADTASEIIVVLENDQSR